MKNKFKQYLNNVIKKYFGQLKYIVTLLGVDGSVDKYSVETEKELNEIISKVNDEKYWIVQKIEKIRYFEYSTNKKIYHTPLFFYDEKISEYHMIKDQPYLFIKIDKSLTNVERCREKLNVILNENKKSDGKTFING